MLNVITQGGKEVATRTPLLEWLTSTKYDNTKHWQLRQTLISLSWGLKNVTASSENNLAISLIGKL